MGFPHLKRKKKISKVYTTKESIQTSLLSIQIDKYENKLLIEI